MRTNITCETRILSDRRSAKAIDTTGEIYREDMILVRSIGTPSNEASPLAFVIVTAMISWGLSWRDK